MSTLTAAPLLKWLAPKALDSYDLRAFAHAQSTALEAVKTVSASLCPGWSEKKAASLVDTYLRDCGVKDFFHHSFAWYGERTRFDGIKNYAAFSPSNRILQEGEVYILDTAPIVNGYICDIGYSGCVGENLAYSQAIRFLWHLRREIPRWSLESETGGALWKRVEQAFSEAGYECAHLKYPFGVLGHRVHGGVRSFGKSKVLNFGLSSFFELSSRLLWDQLLTKNHARPLRGAWAIEPHLGASGFGAKFEEILYVRDTSAEWLHLEDQACLPPI